MIAELKKSIASMSARPVLRAVIQACVSIVLIGVLVTAARQSDLGAILAAIPPGAFILALLAHGFGFALNTRRWQLLLRSAGINQPFWTLLQLYLIGLFFSLFLPTSAGGDAMRMYQVARRSGRVTEAIMGTLQERFLGLGASLVIGLAAMFYYLPLVPEGLRAWVTAIALASIAVVAFVIYPQLMFGIVRKVWSVPGNRPIFESIRGRPMALRVTTALQPIAAIPSLPPLRLIVLLTLSLSAVLAGICSYYIISHSLNLNVSFIAFCLVVPMVWIVRMIPVSLGGIGVGEGSFVFLMGLFAVASGSSLALALTVLAIQTVFALVGGLLLALHVVRGSWLADRTSRDADRKASLPEMTL